MNRHLRAIAIFVTFSKFSERFGASSFAGAPSKLPGAETLPIPSRAYNGSRIGRFYLLIYHFFRPLGSSCFPLTSSGPVRKVTFEIVFMPSMKPHENTVHVLWLQSLLLLLLYIQYNTTLQSLYSPSSGRRWRSQTFPRFAFSSARVRRCAHNDKCFVSHSSWQSFRQTPEGIHPISRISFSHYRCSVSFRGY